MRRVLAVLMAALLVPDVAAAQATSFGDGTHLVGTDIKPGTYRAQASEGCYWERLSGLSGQSNDTIANDYVGSSGQVVVTIAATDVAFHTEDCGTWTLAGSKPSTSGSGSGGASAEIAKWLSLTARSPFGDLLAEWGEDFLDSGTRSAVRTEARRLQTEAAGFDLSPCWMPAFMAWWDSLTLVGASMDMVEAGEVSAAVDLMGAAAAKLGEVNDLLPSAPCA